MIFDKKNGKASKITYSIYDNKSSKDRTWSAEPDALLRVIKWSGGLKAEQRPQRADVL